jgi:hypothetical protein
MADGYFEEEPPLRIPSRGLFNSAWRQLVNDHVVDCNRQRRVFREALNAIRAELLEKTAGWHAENQQKMAELARQIADGQKSLAEMQKWIFGGVVMLLISMLAYLLTHYGPFAGNKL